jgi:hypothetical protein
MPTIDVPTARYIDALAETGLASITGAKVPFEPAKLKALYGDHATYVRKFSEVTDAALKSRLILPKDEEDMKAAAGEADIP